MRRIWCLCYIAVLLVLAQQAWAGKVLVIESYHQGFSWDESYLRGIYGVLSPEHEIRTFEMDTKRIPEEFFADKADEAFVLFQEYQPDLVVLADDNANRFMAPKLLGTGVPIVFLGLNNNPREYGLYGYSHVAGIIERPLLFASVNIARKISPFSMKKVLFLFDSSETSNLVVASAFHDGTSKDICGVRADARQVSTVAEWMETVRSAKKSGYDLIFVGLLQRLKDARGLCTKGESVLEWTVENAPVPCLGLWDFSIGKGKLPAGLVHLGEYQGRAAGEIAKKLLAGERNVGVPLTVEEGVFMFSRSEAEKAGLIIPPALQADAVVVE